MGEPYKKCPECEEHMEKKQIDGVKFWACPKCGHRDIAETNKGLNKHQKTRGRKKVKVGRPKKIKGAAIVIPKVLKTPPDETLFQVPISVDGKVVANIKITIRKEV